ncbi:pyridoxal phosphate-dependent decarboxylase family protein [Parvicella tangerina]|uniref:Tryptophan decarboxylase n=1 Tax=Parvicella tangerina TaxID=2829795 RepID=A0A916JLW8_9FLAO|nr:aminotransferase class I/II-fold pyridoxal phosphate-dependent enzyme [Parvicella tangerina]CAG5078436.1 Tryptophan decarboxylase [Parvicella tangerina]
MWKKKSQEEIKAHVFSALEKNVNYQEATILGIPASHLDDHVFSQDAAFLKDAPFMSTLVQNPNNIGCHTLGKSESFFAGSQEIEKEVLEICAEDILKCQPGQYDGYVASGGTEANIQALWIYRNYFQQEHKAQLNEILILCSEDSHYSMDKGANLLAIDIQKVPVNPDDRTLEKEELDQLIKEAQANGKKYFIVVINMMTTMFGSVDDVEVYIAALEDNKAKYMLHIDGAYGGFYYPFTKNAENLNLSHPKISSVTLDAHKMAQAPYGTGIFLAKKGLIQYANTKEASYVEGEDYTLIGSRSGANATAVWMILSKNGPYGWQEKVFVLQRRCEWMCEQLDQLNIEYYRYPNSNIITIRSEFVPAEVAKKYGLVPDNHQNPKWFKIVVMDHATIEKLEMLVEDLRG